MKFFLACLLACFPLAAHVGVNDVFFEGLAGPYPLYITIRPPVVIPGVAEISIRSSAKDVTSIQIAPMTLTGAGSKYPPTPDQAVQSKQDPQTFTGGLWIMSPGSWQVRATVAGVRGPGVVAVPVRAASQRVSTMDATTGAILAVLMLVLAAGIVGIAGAAVREAQLDPGAIADPARIRRGRIAMAGGVAVSAAIIWFGGDWWNSESAAYAKSIYKPTEMRAVLSNQNLDLLLTNSGWLQPKSLDDFVPDHGHLMHLYAIREPKLDAAFHLHPNRVSPGKFSLQLPPMPAGRYRLFADVVHESGFPETLTSAIELATPTPGPAASPDDAGAIFQASGLLPDGAKVTLESPSAPKAGQPVSLRFKVVDADGNPAANLRPYLGMPAHLAIVKQDFSVFSHVHPNGNISMAAFEMSQTNNLRFNNNVLVSSHAKDDGGSASPAEFSFPFGFPSSGPYKLILQFARPNRVETVTFDIAVQN